MSQLTELPIIECVQVVHANGERVYEPLADYVRNPAPGTYRLTESRKCRPEIISTGRFPQCLNNPKRVANGGRFD